MAQFITVIQMPKGTKKFYTAAPGSTNPIPVLPANANRISVVIINNGSQTVYLGGDPEGFAQGAALSSTTGAPLLAGASITDTSSIDSWWALAASTTGDLRIIETSKPG